MHCADTRDLQRCGRQAVQIQVDLAAYICIYTYTDTFDVCHSINIVAYNGCYHLLLVLLSLTDFFPHYLSLSSSFTTRVYASTNMHACMIFFLVLALLPLHLYVCTCVLDFSSHHFFFDSCFTLVLLAVTLPCRKCVEGGPRLCCISSLLFIETISHFN